ncbi:hypothetical protein ACFWZ2_12805 [Streptomyces sp. NPDC059002]|uniref:hypothetical protein n=1 Tax=Streptomyces sp. NPDC059002 TaxID=3346690 RepID=UPI00369A733A
MTGSVVSWAGGVALVANRLTSPAPLVRVEDWARCWAVEEARASGEFGIDVARMHWDMTSVSAHGAFPAEGQDEDFPVIGHGHPKDRRFDLKQVQAGLAVSADGSIPLHARVFGGGAAEVSQAVGAMKDLRAMAGERDLVAHAPVRVVRRCAGTAHHWSGRSTTGASGPVSPYRARRRR